MDTTTRKSEIVFACQILYPFYIQTWRYVCLFCYFDVKSLNLGIEVLFWASQAIGMLLKQFLIIIKGPLVNMFDLKAVAHTFPR